MAGGREKCPEPSSTRARQAPASSSPNDEAVFQRLAALPVIDYERVRADEAENLGVRISVLDKEVSKRQALK